METYRNQQNARYLSYLMERRSKLPDFLNEYFLSISTSAIRTQEAYACDLNMYFEYLHTQDERFSGKEISEFSLSDLASISTKDINRYTDNLLNERRLSPPTIRRRLSAVNSVYEYFCSEEILEKNPVQSARKPADRRTNDIVHLPYKEMICLSQLVENDTRAVGKRKTVYERLRHRDFAVINILIFTGMRVSECVGLDISDVDMSAGKIRCVRKGYSRKSVIVMNNDIRRALEVYLPTRCELQANPASVNALFLSTQGNRLSVGGIEGLVRKYALDLSPANDRITPHKLRASFATALYEKTGDIYLVSKALNHQSVSTTARYYASMDSAQLSKAYTTLGTGK